MIQHHSIINSIGFYWEYHGIYPVVMSHSLRTGTWPSKHWVFPWIAWWFSIVMFVYQRVGIMSNFQTPNNRDYMWNFKHEEEGFGIHSQSMEVKQCHETCPSLKKHVEVVGLPFPRIPRAVNMALFDPQPFDKPPHPLVIRYIAFENGPGEIASFPLRSQWFNP